MSKYTTREQDGYGNLFENDTLIYIFEWIQDADFAKSQLDKKDKQIAELQSEIEDLKWYKERFLYVNNSLQELITHFVKGK